jgi:hypothetical protein
MLIRVFPVEYVRPMRCGRTKPLLLVCETPAGDLIEVVAKFSAGCDEGVSSLAREVLAACLAAALGLPVPEPYLIEVTPNWIATVSDSGERARIQSSSPVAFGSRLLTGQYAAWSPGNLIRDVMLPTASAIFVFDAITQNPDRRTDNPNCLVKGDEFRLRGEAPQKLCR